MLRSGELTDAILALMALEAVALLSLWRFAGRGIKPLSLLTNSAAGAFLVLALRAALTGGSAAALEILLALAFAAHLCDLALRWTAAGRTG